uniref:VWFA domain-containing protein n=1 Tax=Caenorhabditis japonica TaxID=281687 RepID=A0A8R1HYK9_CAEJA
MESEVPPKPNQLGIPTSTATTERECQCILNNLYLDVYLVVDVSNQMGTNGLLEVAANVNSVFGDSQVRVGDHYADNRGVRVGLITYASYSTVVSNLSDFQSTDELTKAVYDLKPSKDYTSNLQSPLKVIQQQLLKYTDKNSPRNNTKTVVIVYAADYYDYDEPTISQIGNQLKQDGVIIITVADITRNDHYQIIRLAELASPGNGFTVNDEYPSEEVQQALCRANCFCPRMYHQFFADHNGTAHYFGSCVRYDIEYIILFENLAAQREPFQYHVGLHFVNGGYFWEQSTGLPLVPLVNPLYPLPPKPATSEQCVGNTENMTTKEEIWQNVNCFNELSGTMCEVAACDTENYCA